jgi:hypothetical protein
LSAPPPGRPLRTAAFIAAVISVVGAGSLLGLRTRLPAGLLVLLGLGALAAQLRPEWATRVAVLVGGLALLALNPVFGLYFGLLLAGLTASRHRRASFAAVLIVGAIVLPKLAFWRGYHTPGLWNWLNEPSLALAIFVSAWWWRHRWDGDSPGRAASPGRPAAGTPTSAPRGDRDALAFLLLYLFPTHATNPMVFGPRVLWRPLHTDGAAICRQLGWFVAKVAALSLLGHAPIGHPLLRDLSAPMVRDLSRAGLWRVVGLSYLETFLVLAASADVPIIIARLFGWPLPAAFRAPLLAWNPVELWRRWGIYNRQFLLRVVYFPLGGNRRHRYLNVFLTFLASALVLHSGWFGSKYLAVGTAGWRDESLYFSSQALAVCGCLAAWKWSGKDPGDARSLRWSGARALATAATQAYSALAHVVILAQGIDLPTRLRLIGRCLGW